MQLEEITLALFTACNSIRVFAYVPQIHKAATDKNGTSVISRMTWSLFLAAHLSTVAYALINRSDPWLAICFAGNALCCVAILAIAYWRGETTRRSCCRSKRAGLMLRRVRSGPIGQLGAGRMRTGRGASRL